MLSNIYNKYALIKRTFRMKITENINANEYIMRITYIIYIFIFDNTQNKKGFKMHRNTIKKKKKKTDLMHVHKIDVFNVNI